MIWLTLQTAWSCLFKKNHFYYQCFILSTISVYLSVSGVRYSLSHVFDHFASQCHNY